MVGIILDATAHTAGIVCYNSTNHTCIQRSRIRTYFLTMYQQALIHLATNQTRFKLYGSLLSIKEEFLPVSPYLYKNTIRDGLARK